MHTRNKTYSVIHLAIQLSYLLVLLGLFYIYTTYVKLLPLHTKVFETVRTAFQFTGAKAVPAHYFEFLNNSEVMFFIAVFFLSVFLFVFVSASLQGSTCI